MQLSPTKLNHFQSLISNLPKATFAMAYGSGVFKQISYSSADKPMVDFILGVDNTVAWHRENLAKNPSHYSFVKNLPNAQGVISYLQDELPSFVYFNTNIKVNDSLIKYGVINVSKLKEDLHHWSTFYVSGRLQKPVAILHNDDLEIEIYQESNLRRAAICALILLPETFTEEELYLKVASLSYMGDLRLGFEAENPNKVQNIVMPHFRAFVEWYRYAINYFLDQKMIKIIDLKLREGDQEMRIFKKAESYDENNLVTLLPFYKPTAVIDSPQSFIINSITKIVESSSLEQAVKGFFTVGFMKSIKYAWDKKKKANKESNHPAANNDTQSQV